MKKKVTYFIILLLLSGLIYLLAYYQFPLVTKHFFLLMLLLIFDGYIWLTARKSIAKKKKPYKIFLRILYWIPYTMVFLLVLLSLVLPVYKWNSVARTYFMGAIFVAYVSKLVPLVFIFINNISNLFRKVFRHFYHKHSDKQLFADNKITRGRFLENAGFLAGGFMFSGLVWGMFSNIYNFRVRNAYIKLPKLPGILDGLRIVQISDFHLGSWYSVAPFEKAVKMVNDLDPDLVFFTGDLVNYSSNEALIFKDYLEQIRSRHGIFSILGNHDYGDYVHWGSEEEKMADLEKMHRFHESLGWKLLRNEHVNLDIKGKKLGIIGVENWSTSTRFPRYGDIQLALKDLPGDLDIRLLLSHDPTHWESEVSSFYPDIDITFAGHTHGMQFGIDIPGMIKWSPAQYIYKFWAGLYVLGKDSHNPQYLYVNRGLGHIGYPGRIGILPEITLITLQSV